MPACNSYSFHVESLQVNSINDFTFADKKSVQYKRNEPGYQEHMRKRSGESSEIEFVSAIIRVSEDANILHEETPTYSMTNLLSDVGGALGLCLGLCIWQMVHSVMQAVVMVVNKAENLANKAAFKKSKSLAKKKIGRKSRHFTTPSIRRQALESDALSRDQSNNSLICGNPICPMMSPIIAKDGLKVNNNEKTLYLFSV